MQMSAMSCDQNISGAHSLSPKKYEVGVHVDGAVHGGEHVRYEESLRGTNTKHWFHILSLLKRGTVKTRFSIQDKHNLQGLKRPDVGRKNKLRSEKDSKDVAIWQGSF